MGHLRHPGPRAIREDLRDEELVAGRGPAVEVGVRRAEEVDGALLVDGLPVRHLLAGATELRDAEWLGRRAGEVVGTAEDEGPVRATGVGARQRERRVRIAERGPGHRRGPGLVRARRVGLVAGEDEGHEVGARGGVADVEEVVALRRDALVGAGGQQGVVARVAHQLDDGRAVVEVADDDVVVLVAATAVIQEVRHGRPIRAVVPEDDAVAVLRAVELVGERVGGREGVADLPGSGGLVAGVHRAEDVEAGGLPVDVVGVVERPRQVVEGSPGRDREVGRRADVLAEFEVVLRHSR